VPFMVSMAGGVAAN